MVQGKTVLYVIPFIILLVVAIIFIIRQRRQNASSSSHAKNNKNNEIKTSENDLSAAKAPVTIDPNIHERIDHLIDIGHLSAAEALINQTLNRDPSRHDLYLYLLDLHLRQNDELGIKQLIQNLQQLQLHDVLNQIEGKYRNTHEQKEKYAKIIQQKQQNIQDIPRTASPTATAAIKVETTHANPAPVQKHIIEEHQDLEFNPKPIAPVNKSEKSNTVPHQDISFVLEMADQITVPPKKNEAAAEVKVENQTRKLAASAPQALNADQEASHLAQPKVVEPRIDTPPVHTPVPPPTLTRQDTPPITLKQHLPPVAESLQPQPAQITVDHDPLIQAFPELANLDETQLDLELAEQYIELGAYASAQILLNQNEAKFSAQQLELSKKLLNRMAS